MDKMTLTVKGKLGDLSLVSFLMVLNQSLNVLKDLDRRISEQRKGTMKWVITRVGEGESVQIEIAPKIMQGKNDYANVVLETFTNGIDQMTSIGTTPRYFSVDDVTSVRTIIRQFRRNGLMGVDYHIEGSIKKAELDSKSGEKVEPLVGVDHKSLGSIEGKVELVSVHKNSKHFNIYHTITQKAIRCNLPKDIEPDVFKATEGRNRIIATGMISYNKKGEPIGIRLMKPLRFLKDEDVLPSIEDMLGSDPHITDDLDTEDYIRSIRE